MANMLRCTLASGGGALILTVTTDSNFAGKTITCTDGTTTLTQICPSSSPYEVEFKLPNAGQWTISGVISGETCSITVDIPDNVALHYVPNGSTITPTDDIQIWLHCANIWDKAYTSISQVLADASTLQALIASNNAADYMARSTTWSTDVTADSSAMSYIGLNDYCADALLLDSTWLSAICNSTYFESVLNVKVPTMTSNTVPSGVASASSKYANDWEAFEAFDSSITTGWLPANDSGAGSWLKYEFVNQIKLYKWHISTRASGSLTVRIKLQGSNDNNTWEDIDSYTLTGASDDVTRIIDSNVSAYKYLRIYGIDRFVATYWKGITVLQYYGRA